MGLKRNDKSRSQHFRMLQECTAQHIGALDAVGSEEDSK